MAQFVLDSLQRRITPEEAEKEHMEDGIPFGHIHAEWCQLKAQLREGDELWYFRTPDATWQSAFPRCGLEGYAIIRAGQLVAQILTSIS